MKKTNLKCASVLVSLLLLGGAGAAHASGEITARVLSFGVYGNGNVYVAIDQTINEPGCPLPYIEVLVNSAVAKTVFAQAALAVATGATVTLRTDSCVGGLPTFSDARTGYFTVNKL